LSPTSIPYPRHREKRILEGKKGEKKKERRRKGERGGRQASAGRALSAYVQLIFFLHFAILISLDCAGGGKKGNKKRRERKEGGKV